MGDSDGTRCLVSILWEPTTAHKQWVAAREGRREFLGGRKAGLHPPLHMQTVVARGEGESFGGKEGWTPPTTAHKQWVAAGEGRREFLGGRKAGLHPPLHTNSGSLQGREGESFGGKEGWTALTTAHKQWVAAREGRREFFGGRKAAPTTAHKQWVAAREGRREFGGGKEGWTAPIQ